MTSESRSDNAQVLDGFWTNSTGKEDHCESIGPGRKPILSNTVQGWGESLPYNGQEFPRARDTREMIYNHPSHVTVQEKVGYKHSGRIIQPRRMKS